MFFRYVLKLSIKADRSCDVSVSVIKTNLCNFKWCIVLPVYLGTNRSAHQSSFPKLNLNGTGIHHELYVAVRNQRSTGLV